MYEPRHQYVTIEVIEINISVNSPLSPPLRHSNAFKYVAMVALSHSPVISGFEPRHLRLFW